MKYTLLHGWDGWLWWWRKRCKVVVLFIMTAVVVEVVGARVVVKLIVK